MTQLLHLDTHVVVWLYAGEHDRFPSGLRRRLNTDSLRVSPMVRLELTYLHEIGKLTEAPHRIITELENAIGLAESTLAFGRVIDLAERATFTRDPFDRIITAQALYARASLATKDARIRAAHPADTVWD